jgi:hypothetical protein
VQNVHTLPAGIELVALLAFSGAAVLCWVMASWGGWAEGAYERAKSRPLIWYWLCVFRIPTTRDNCIRFIKIVSASGIVLVSVTWTFVLIRLR